MSTSIFDDENKNETSNAAKKEKKKKEKIFDDDESSEEEPEIFADKKKKETTSKKIEKPEETSSIKSNTGPESIISPRNTDEESTKKENKKVNFNTLFGEEDENILFGTPSEKAANKKPTLKKNLQSYCLMMMKMKREDQLPLKKMFLKKSKVNLLSATTIFEEDEEPLATTSKTANKPKPTATATPTDGSSKNSSIKFGLFDDDDKKSTPGSTPRSQTQSPIPQVKKSDKLFGDDDEDDARSTTSNTSNTSATDNKKKSTNLFGDEDEDENENEKSVPAVIETKKKYYTSSCKISL